MEYSDLPSFWIIMGNFFCIIVSAAMLFVLLYNILILGVLHSPLAFWGLFAGFSLVIWYAVSRLGEALFPAKVQSSRACVLIRKVMEIEWV